MNFVVELNFPHWFDYIHEGLPVRAINRPGSQLLGANGRDTGPVVSLLSSIDYSNSEISVIVFSLVFF